MPNLGEVIDSLSHTDWRIKFRDNVGIEMRDLLTPLSLFQYSIIELMLQKCVNSWKKGLTSNNEIKIAGLSIHSLTSWPNACTWGSVTSTKAQSIVESNFGRLLIFTFNQSSPYPPPPLPPHILGCLLICLIIITFSFLFYLKKTSWNYKQLTKRHK